MTSAESGSPKATINLDFWLFQRLKHQLKLLQVFIHLQTNQSTVNNSLLLWLVLVLRRINTLLGSDMKWTSKIIKNNPRIIDTDISNGDATNFSIVNLLYGFRTHLSRSAMECWLIIYESRTTIYKGSPYQVPG